MNPERLPDQETVVWVRSHLPHAEFIQEFAHGHGYSHLWRIRAGERSYWLKLHAHPNKWGGEVNALRRWTSPFVPSPTIVGVRDNPPSLLMTEVEGLMAEAANLEPAEEMQLWRDAGSYIRTLQEHQNDWFGQPTSEGSPSGSARQDPIEFVAGSFDARIHQGIEKALWSQTELDFIQKASKDWPTALQGETPVAVHRDFSPRNWLVQPNGSLSAVIDWEHARWDVRAADLNRPWDTDFVHKPYLPKALEEGYGGFDDALRQQILALRLLGAVASIVWATDVGDTEFLRINRIALERLRTL